jgi:hypothetical protein
VRVALACALACLGCAELAVCPNADLGPLPRAPAYAFVASDYASSAIGLLDEQGEVIREAWLDSGTAPAGLVTPLSGDVVLASNPLAPCVVAVIDRYLTDVVTLLDVCAPEPLLGQLAVGAGRSNPRDVVALDERRALVSRYSSRLGPDVSPMERGNDLLLIDWRERRVLSRVDLAALDVHEPEHVLARPDRMVRLERDGASVVIVGLARLGADYMVAGRGAVAVIEVDALTARALELPGLANCGEVDAVPGHAQLAVVTCAGRPFAPIDERRDEAGVVLLELVDGAVQVRGGWHARQHPDAPVLNAWSVPLSDRQVVTIAMGDFLADLDDRAGLVDPHGGEAASLMRAGDAFVLGDGAFDPGSGLLLVPDADRGGMRRFQVDGDGTTDGIVERELVPTATCRGLPPREVRRIAGP